MPTGGGEVGLPPAIELVIATNVPLPWVVRVDSNDPNTIFKCIRDIDIEILLVVDVLKSPAIAVLDELPLWRDRG